ncbi:MAG: hypothetical protein J6K96_02355 [Treponema sp.]|nr:hypothetical protein [Treponema sp.]
MKKAMIALAGVLSMLMLASCTKEVEIDGDVDRTDVTNQSYEYMLKAEGTVTWTKEFDWRSGTMKDVNKSVSVTSGQISWETDASASGNAKKYYLDVEWKAADDTTSFSWPFYRIVKYNNKYYAGSIADTNEIEITNPESSSFSVKGTYKNGTSDNATTYTIDVKFSR